MSGALVVLERGTKVRLSFSLSGFMAYQSYQVWLR
jgi:hypothetical protein